MNKMYTPYRHNPHSDSVQFFEYRQVFKYIVDNFLGGNQRMLTHYFTLHAISGELHSTLMGASITEIFTQQKNELVISFSNSGGDNKLLSDCSLSISVSPKLNYIFFREKVSRAKKNSVDLFQNIIGTSVAKITMLPYDRTIQFTLDNGCRLLAKLYNTIESNIVLVDDHSVIVEAFKDDKRYRGKEFVIERSIPDERVLHDFGAFNNTAMKDTSATIFVRLKHVIPILGSTLAREVLHRTNVDEKTKVHSLDEMELRGMYEEIQNILNEIGHPQPTIYYRGDEAKVLSMIPLTHLAGSRAETFQSVNEAIRSFIVRTFRLQNIEQDKKRILERIKAELTRAHRAIDALNEQLTNALAAEEYEHIGKLIMANLQHLTKGTKVVEIPDIFSNDKSIRLTLDPKLTPARNAERYFEKAKQTKVVRAEAEGRLHTLEKKVSHLEKLLLHLDNCHTLDQLKEFKKEY
ncbi:MAG TPA: NFACT family protein, partial [Bacteroidota bacterium]|nr:NFACT family protein [Bacteroidota bacterium]